MRGQLKSANWICEVSTSAEILASQSLFCFHFFFKKHSWFGLEIMDRPRRGWSVATHIARAAR